MRGAVRAGGHPVRALSWCLCAVLALLGLRLGALHLRPGTGFSTLPILIPVSLEHEAAGRGARARAPLDTARVEALLARLEAGPVDPSLAPRIEALADDRAALLALRDRRHQLNLALMRRGAVVARLLEPAQWEVVVNHRDAARGEAEAAVLDRVLEGLR